MGFGAILVYAADFGVCLQWVREQLRVDVTAQQLRIDAVSDHLVGADFAPQDFFAAPGHAGKAKAQLWIHLRDAVEGAQRGNGVGVDAGGFVRAAEKGEQSRGRLLRFELDLIDGKDLAQQDFACAESERQEKYEGPDPHCDAETR